MGLEWDSIAVSTVLSAVVGISTAWYFRFRVKPKNEIVFDINRKSNLETMFKVVDLFDSKFETFYSTFEKNMGELKPNKEIKILSPFIFTDFSSFLRPKLKFLMLDKTKEFTELIIELSPVLTEMKNYHKQFLQDYHFLMTYVDDHFLRMIQAYYFSTITYADNVIRGRHYPNFAMERKEFAHKIIENIKKDKSIDLNIAQVKKFITKWQKS